MIRVIRGQQVIIDRDLALLYGVETRALKGGDRRLPYAFTEQGIAMLSSVLKSQTAVEVNIRIMRAFVSMRRFIVTNAQLFQRLETIEYHQLEMKRHQEVTDKRIDEVFKRLEANIPPMQGIFYDGQVFDAYRFVSDLIRKAKRTQRVSDRFQLDVDRHNAQYPPVRIERFNKAHDRFLLIDDEVYHIGASIKDLGKKWFGFTLMRDIPASEIINRKKWFGFTLMRDIPASEIINRIKD